MTSFSNPSQNIIIPQETLKIIVFVLFFNLKFYLYKVDIKKKKKQRSGALLFNEKALFKMNVSNQAATLHPPFQHQLLGISPPSLYSSNRNLFLFLKYFHLVPT